MLQFFRINDPYKLVFIFLILLGVRVAWIVYGLPLSHHGLKFLLLGERLGDGFIMYRDLYDYTGPLSAFVYKGIDFVFGRSRWVHVVLSTILIIVQAGIFNNILLRNKAYRENTYVPAFVYVILFCGTPDFFVLSPQLMSVTFILLALNHVFRRIDNEVTDELFLYSGLYLGLASFFYLHAFIFVLLFLLSLVLFSTAVSRRLLIFIYGAFLILLVLWSYFFWFEANADFLFSFFKAGLLRPPHSLLSYAAFIRSALVLGSVMAVSFLALFTERGTNFQQKMQQVMMMLIIGALIIVLVNRDLNTGDLILFIPSITFFLVYFLLSLRRRLFKYLMPYLIVFSLVLYPFYWMKSEDSTNLIVDKEACPVSGEKLMGIGVPLDYYADNKICGPFLDDYLSTTRLSGIDYFDGASKIYDAILESKPTVIIDHNGIIPHAMIRLPQLSRLYEKTDEGIYRKVEN